VHELVIIETGHVDARFKHEVKEILRLRDVLMQKILITVFYCNNVNIILIWHYTLVFYSILTSYISPFTHDKFVKYCICV